MGSLYLILGKYEQAIVKLEKTIDLRRFYYLPYMNLSLVYSCLEKDVEKNENFEKAYNLLERTDENEKMWILREYNKFLSSAKEDLLKEENDDGEKRSHNERFSQALEEVISRIEE